MKKRISVFLSAAILFLISVELGDTHNFMIGDRPFRFVGSFVPGWHWAGEVWTPSISEDLIKTAKENGISVFHLMLPGIEPQLGIFQESELQKLDIFLQYASKYGVYVMISFIHAYAIVLQPNDPYYHPGGIEGLIKNKELKDAFKKRIERIVTRENTVNGKLYKCDSTIMGWILVDEPISAPWNYPISPPNVTILELRAWFQEIADYVKSLDLIHLVTVFTTAAIDSLGERWPNAFDVSSLDFNYAEDADARTLELISGIRADDYPLRLFSLSRPLVIQLTFGSGVWNQEEISTDYIWQAQTLRKSSKNYLEAGVSGIGIFHWGGSSLYINLYKPYMPSMDIPYNYNPTIEPICTMLKETANELGTLNWPEPPLRFVTIIPIQFSLTVMAAQGGTTDLSPGIYTYDVGTEVTISAIPYIGYRFENWSGDVSSTDNPITIIIDGDKSITANFIRQYTLTITAVNGGTTDPAPGTYTHDTGTQVTIRAIPSSGYSFSGWSGDLSGTTNPTSIKMNGPKTVTANFNATNVPDILITPLTYDFGNVEAKKSKTASFKVKNNGKADLLISTSITGTDVSMFTITSGGGVSKTIKPGKPLTIKVAFKPTSGGSKSSTLRITSNDPDTPTIDIPLTGTAPFSAKTPDISVAQTTLDFGSIKVGKRGTKTLKITNNGTGDLVITLSGLEGTDFSIQGSSGVTIKGKKSYSLKVLFMPKSSGLEAATLMMSSNDPDTPTLEISLSGTGQ